MLPGLSEYPAYGLSDKKPTAPDAADGSRKLSGKAGLAQQTPHIQVKHGLKQSGIAQGRHDDHWQRRKVPANALQQTQAIVLPFDGHHEVSHQHIAGVAFEHLKQFVRIAGLGDDAGEIVLFQYDPQADEKNRVVISHDDPQRAISGIAQEVAPSKRLYAYCTRCSELKQ